jgi:PadR family transcriptional regulator, regulatory protein PadR
MKGDRLRGHLPALVLGALADGPAHGYEIIVRLRERSGGEFELAEGTVYPVLHRLQEQRLLNARHVEVAGRTRKVYALTAAGRRELAAERTQWQRFSQVVSQVMGAPA